MKHLLFILLLSVAGALHSFAHDCQIPVATKIIDNTGNLSTSNLNAIESAILKALPGNGFTGAEEATRFCLVVSVDEGSKDIISGIKPTVTLSIDVNLYVSNIITGERFTAETISLSGAGQNEKTAYKKACAKFNGSNIELNKYLETTDLKIREYYDKQLDNILKDVDALMVKRDFAQSLWVLSAIPSCTKNYDKVLKKMSNVFQQYIDLDCQQKIANARALWAASQNKDGAMAALASLAGIDPESSCNDEADRLFKEIYNRVKEENADDKNLDKEMLEFYKEMCRADIENERARIEAMRAIGKAYGENQQEQNIILK